MSAIDHKVTMARGQVNDYFVLPANLMNHRRFKGKVPTYNTCNTYIRGTGFDMPQTKKQNVTISLDTQVVMKAKILAAKRSTSISGLLAEQVEALVNEDDARERSIASTIARLKRGFHLGGGPYPSRESLHER
jgi:uncharacterized protein DUF6364